MKVLIVGMGSIGQRHARNLRHLYGNNVTLIAHRTERRAPVLSDTLEVMKDASMEDTYQIESFSSLDIALRENPDVAFICNPSSMHLESSLQCVRAGCSVFIEKPVCTGLEGTDELISSVEQKKVTAYVGYQYRFHPCFKIAADVLKSGTLGRITAVNAHVGEHLPHFHKYEDYRTTYPARKDLGGGVVLSQIHELDYLFALFGMPKSVYSIGGHLSRLEIDVEDVAASTFEFSIGGAPTPVHLHQDFLQVPPSRTLKVTGDSGTLDVDFLNMKANVTNTTGEKSSWDFVGKWKRNDMFLDELKHFMNCVEGRETALVSIRDGIASVKMAISIKKSMQSKCPVIFD